ncbi:MAG TPA: ubiquitin-like small modifier protein 1 [Anaerolineales bacterium]|nr:ubiquitin-like small modifier protein 1 [Anaerolineales bacterium]
MKINFYASLRQTVGQKTVNLNIEQGSTIHELVHQIVTAYPALREQLLDQHGQLLGYVHVMINGRDAPYLKAGLDTKVQMTDKVDIFPAVGGGSCVSQ